MTREEAREALSVLKIYDAQWLREAVDMAIEALQADAVPSEQYKKGFEDAKRAFELEYARESENMRKRNAQLEVMLNAQKAISADAEWIPVSERLPSMRTEVIYSYDGIVSTGYITDRDCIGEKTEEHWEDLESGAYIEPIAWMPLPKPYRESEVEE